MIETPKPKTQWFAEILDISGVPAIFVFDKKKDLLKYIQDMLQGGGVLNRVIKGKQVPTRVTKKVEID